MPGDTNSPARCEYSRPPIEPRKPPRPDAERNAALSLAASHLHGLLEATRAVQGGSDLGAMLHAMARSIAKSLGFGTVVINLYRPAWHDFEVVAVEGVHDARRVLLGSAATAEQWAPLMDERFRRGGAYLVPEGELHSRTANPTYVPERRPLDDPDAWLPGDALFVPLLANDGTVRGILSVDEPTSGLRPGPEEIEGLVAVASQASLAVEAAQRAEEAGRHHAAAEQLLRVSARLGRERDIERLTEQVCTGISEALGFDRVVMYLRDRERGCLAAAGAHGWSETELAALPPLELGDVRRLLRPDLEQDGCVLLDRTTAHAMTRDALRSVYTSRANGRGPHAWSNHWLVIPLRDDQGGIEGMIWADDPRDRLKPGRDRLRVLRCFGDLVTAALGSARELERLGQLAEHDPLTGLRNRRRLRRQIDDLIWRADGVLGLVVFDIDAFKRVNDVLGYGAGDRVLRAVAATLRDACPPDGFAARLGGEDFALVLPGFDAAAALRASEAVRRNVRGSVTMVPWEVTLSAGVVMRDESAPDAAALLRAATRALFAAKRLGRDRSVTYSADALEALLGTLEDEAADEQLSAMILLAETLDLRDPRTARHSQTVGRYAEQIARALGWSPARVERVRIAGVLHDIGKLGLPDAILFKPGALDDAEWAEIRRHPEMGARILDHANLRDVAEWVLCHHERVEGRGYPRGLSRREIPMEARILSVADAYEAMTADRPYRRAMPAEEARRELLRERGAQFDTHVVETFVSVLGA